MVWVVDVPVNSYGHVRMVYIDLEFSSTFQGRSNFQGLFKKALFILILSSLHETLSTIPINGESV